MMTITRRRLDPGEPPRLTPETKARLGRMTAETIERNARDDADNPPLTAEDRERIATSFVVRNARQRSGLTEEAFARRFHVDVGRLRDWERGRYTPGSVEDDPFLTIQGRLAATEYVLKLTLQVLDQLAPDSGMQAAMHTMLTTSIGAATVTVDHPALAGDMKAFVERYARLIIDSGFSAHPEKP